ncbi:MAG TPA: leucyl aminopeptidase [Gammaproteobacteria bacterium]|jgi:leucyl aminopeptidase
MQFSIKAGVGVKDRSECAILPLFEGRGLTGIASDFDRALKGRIRKLIRSGDASTKPGGSLLLHDIGSTGATNLLLIGCGARKDFSGKQLVRAARTAADVLGKTGIRSATSFLADGAAPAIDAYQAARGIVQGTRFSLYRFTEQKSKTDAAPKLRRMTVVCDDKSQLADGRKGLKHGVAIGNGVDLARDLGNRSPNVCTPSHLATVSRGLGRDNPRLSVKVLSEEQIRKLGMGSFLSVTAAAETPAKLIVMNYKGAGSDEPPVVLCGKGITFDTGGISLKPPAAMDEMKFDMCGAAGVIGAMASLAELELNLNVVALVPTCENMPGGKATKPGDIVTSMSGQTIEILNTDAEGRLILCDALTYAQEFNPRCIIDVATLTGACVIALGQVFTGLFSPDEELSAALTAAGRRAADEAWPMPVTQEYGESLRSNFADFANVGGREGGASVAAQFLSRFVNDVPWAHLDIAGVAWLQGAAKGATGRPVGLLVDYLLDLETA